jgi:formylglycine-generating enzyme required for sulfatase activity
MAPEQAGGRKDIGPAADVYALGAILYELLTGRPPVQAATPLDIILQVLSQEPAPPSRFRPTLDRDLQAICLKCLEKEPTRRYTSARALANDLRRFLDGEPIQARGHGTWERTGKWLRQKRMEMAFALVSALACLLLVAVAFLLLRAPRAAQVPKLWAGSETDQGKDLPRASAVAADALVPKLLDCTGAGGVNGAEVRRFQEAWAKHLGCQVEETVEVGGGVKMTFVLVPPGNFHMGSPAEEKDRSDGEIVHEVTLTEPFYLGQTEVTQAQYQALTGANPSHFRGADRPVEQVSWEQARDYAAELTKKQADKLVYRLPTEAEWEYCCRGGRPSTQPFGVGDGRALSSAEANFSGGPAGGGADKGPDPATTCRVGSYPANALGLYDMHGNVWEWCADWYGPYPTGAVSNPTWPTAGSVRVIRGGSWFIPAKDCRAARRGRNEPSLRLPDLGFRLARSAPSPGQ